MRLVRQSDLQWQLEDDAGTVINGTPSGILKELEAARRLDEEYDLQEEDYTYREERK